MNVAPIVRTNLLVVNTNHFHVHVANNQVTSYPKNAKGENANVSSVCRNGRSRHGIWHLAKTIWTLGLNDPK